MIGTLRARLRHGTRSTPFPPEGPALPPGFRGLPLLDAARCPADCRACAAACPTGAIAAAGAPSLDLGRCLFCPACVEACPEGALTFTRDHRLAASSREGLALAPAERPRVEALGREMRRLFGRSLKLRQVSAGGCNGCEAELNALSNVVFDLGRFGIQFVASPRHADGLVVTGPVPHAMASALHGTWEALPEPRLLVLVGACALSGGVFEGSPAVSGVPRDLPVHLAVPGCPPHPLTLLDGLLGMLGRL